MMPEGMPRLSIVTSCFNHGRFLRESLSSSLGSTVRDIEVVFVDDGSTDDSFNIAREMQRTDQRLRVATHMTNQGHAAALNSAIRMTSAPWILKVYADDKISPSYVEHLLTYAQISPKANVIFSPCQHFGSRKEVYRYPDFEPSRMIDSFMIPGPSAFRRSLWEAVGGFDATMRFAEDWDFWIRAQQAVGLNTVQLRDALWYYRIHDGPRVSAEGIKHIKYLQQYWRGHTKETVLARSRTWGAWCEMKGLETGHVMLGDDPERMTLITHS